MFISYQSLTGKTASFTNYQAIEKTIIWHHFCLSILIFVGESLETWNKNVRCKITIKHIFHSHYHLNFCARNFVRIIINDDFHYIFYHITLNRDTVIKWFKLKMAWIKDRITIMIIKMSVFALVCVMTWTCSKWVSWDSLLYPSGTF